METSTVLVSGDTTRNLPSLPTANARGNEGPAGPRNAPPKDASAAASAPQAGDAPLDA